LAFGQDGFKNLGEELEIIFFFLRGTLFKREGTNYWGKKDFFNSTLRLGWLGVAIWRVGLPLAKTGHF